MTVFNPGVRHDHTPSGRWSEVQDEPNSPGGWKAAMLCKVSSPQQLVDAAIFVEFGDKPIALTHLNWYLSTGKGMDFVEDFNIARMLKTDRGIQSEIVTRIKAKKGAMRFADKFKIEQDMYADQDLRFAFGAIDIFEFEVDVAANTLHGWFQDRYEWHPVYPGLYAKKTGDVPRETNCVHAALVELQSSGAADYWMKGEATVPLSILPGFAPGTSGSGWL